MPAFRVYMDNLYDSGARKRFFAVNYVPNNLVCSSSILVKFVHKETMNPTRPGIFSFRESKVRWLSCAISGYNEGI